MRSLPLLAALCGFATGWFLFQSKPPSTSSPSPQKTSTQKSSPPGIPQEPSTWSNNQIHTLAASLKTELHPVKRQILLDQILAGMTAENADAIRLALSPMYFPDPRFIKFYQHWGRLAGQDIINLYDGRAKQYLFAGWSRTNPDDAREWLEQFEATTANLPAAFHHSIINALAAQDPHKATAYYFSHLNNGRHTGRLEHLGTQIKNTHGIPAWADWAASLPSGYSRQSQLLNVTREWIKTDFENAKSWAETLRGEEAKWAVSRIASHSKNQAGYYWATSLPDPSLHEHAIRGAIQSWVRQNQEEAETHLRQLPPSANRDTALSAYLIRAKMPDFQSGLTWAEQISDTQIRHQALADWAHRRWVKEPELADRFIEQSDLSDELKHRYHQNKDSAR